MCLQANLGPDGEPDKYDEMIVADCDVGDQVKLFYWYEDPSKPGDKMLGLARIEDWAVHCRAGDLGVGVQLDVWPAKGYQSKNVWYKRPVDDSDSVFNLCNPHWGGGDLCLDSSGGTDNPVFYS